MLISTSVQNEVVPTLRQCVVATQASAVKLKIVDALLWLHLPSQPTVTPVLMRSAVHLCTPSQSPIAGYATFCSAAPDVLELTVSIITLLYVLRGCKFAGSCLTARILQPRRQACSPLPPRRLLFQSITCMCNTLVSCWEGLEGTRTLRSS